MSVFFIRKVHMNVWVKCERFIALPVLLFIYRLNEEHLYVYIYVRIFRTFLQLVFFLNSVRHG